MASLEYFQLDFTSPKDIKEIKELENTQAIGVSK